MKWYALRRKDGTILHVATSLQWLEEMRRVVVNYEDGEIVEVEIAEPGTTDALKRAR